MNTNKYRTVMLARCQQLSTKTTRKTYFLAWLQDTVHSGTTAARLDAIRMPANRIGHTAMSVGQLKILQEVITLSVFVPFALFYLREPVKLDYMWAALCLCGAVFFVFRGGVGAG
jgi:uncharacterized protein (DUF486 family)